jgi:hypothetical protein
MMSTSMSTEQILRAWQQQRKADLQEAKNMRNHWQAVVDRLEKQIDSFDNLSPESKEPKTDSDLPKGWLGLKTLDGYNG